MSKDSQLLGSHVIASSMAANGIKRIHIFPGGTIGPVLDIVHNWNIEIFTTRHEQAAVHAAEGYAKASGKVGVAMVTSGPGFTNAVTGLADAYMDSIPIVVFTGQVPRALIGNDAFQEVDIVGITRPCTKHNYLVSDPNELVATIREAFYLAASGRPSNSRASKQRLDTNAISNKRINGTDMEILRNFAILYL